MGRRHTSRAAVDRATRAAASRAMGFVPPWLVWLALPLFGLVFWGLASAGPASAVLVGAVLSVGSAGLTWHTYHVFRARRDRSVQIHAAATTALACAWLIGATAFGLFHRPNVDVWPQVWRIFEYALKSFTLPVWGAWVLGGIIAAVSWNIRNAAKLPDKADTHQDDETPLAKALQGAKLKAITVTDRGQVTGQIEGVRGEQTSDDLQKLAPDIEAAQRLREGAVRITRTAEDRGAATFVITPKDMLVTDVKWRGASLPGGHIADAPILFGVAEDGEPGEMWFPGDERVGRNLVHYLVEGANGSGKSMAWRAAIADALTRTAGAGVRVHGIDVSGKYLQTFGPLLPYLTSLATDPKQAKSLVKTLSAYVAEKQARMGAAGHTQWARDCDEPFDILWLEEGSEIAAESEALTRAAERWRSAGFMLIIVIQRASWDNIDTTTRSQLGGVTCFGVNDSGQGDNSFSLPKDAVEQGAAPERWGSRFAGRHYLITSTTPQERLAIPHRSFKTTNDELAAVLKRHAVPAYRPSAPAAPAQRDTELTVDNLYDDEDGGVVSIPEDPDPTIVVDPRQPIRPPDPAEDLPMRVPGTGGVGPKLSEPEFRQLIQSHLAAIIADGRTKTQAADVHQMRPETGYSRESVRKELVRLCDGPHTERDRFRLTRDEADRLGVYGIYEHGLVHAV